ncbi:aminotransferase class I/II-fold pyridoxal phosphate-dependent enzyme [uncultured Cocleimonas sp.]|uniref:aminotransferase class I/II-fold pyridoxal phosphate-dependent enzyme n=1 Tax=uncultured Cocleimonas sp. TaxID=1051587 RepID=UPI0026058B34|nr:aminotransferase class I/II-fold pyridoxal phosphate-dependent enzyme [uncultured Cocleimonas sp.]
MPLDKFKNNIREYLQDYDGKLFFYWKARVGLYSLLKSMDVGEGDEVILPAFTCVVVPNAILYLGATPIYVDVSTDTYNFDIPHIEKAITNRTKVIICQNTYGLSSDLEQLTSLAKKHGIFTVEDCTHGFGGTYNGTPNGLSCDAAIYSTQWNKPFSTGIGGYLVTNNKEFADKVTDLSAKLMPPTWKELLNLKLLFFVKRYLINNYTYWPLVNFYRWLSHNTNIVGSSTSEEITSLEIPEDYFKAFSDVQAKEGLRNISKLEDDLQKRKENALLYTKFLKKKKKNHVPEDLFPNHSFLKYPLLVKNRDEFMKLATTARIALGEWFVSPLHPVEGDLSLWKFNSDDFPVATYLSEHVVNLPTTPSNINNVFDFLEKHSDFIIDSA